MATITVNVSDETEERFRDVVKQEYGTGKGKLGSAIQEALDAWVRNKKNQEISQRQLGLMEKGFFFGKIKYTRDELHDRSN